MSLYLDDSTHEDQTTRDNLKLSPVVIVPRLNRSVTKVRDSQHEEYLVKWKTVQNAFSWHNLDELKSCLYLVQRYTESIQRPPPGQSLAAWLQRSRKRKLSDSDSSEAGTVDHASAASVNFDVTSSTLSDGSNIDPNNRAYNATLSQKGGSYSVKPLETLASDEQYAKIPSSKMLEIAGRTSIKEAQIKVAAAYDRYLGHLKPPVSVHNHIDTSRPPLDFVFIPKSVERKGVRKFDQGFITGCGGSTGIPGYGQQSCRPNMGHDMGCEYSKLCECLEYAAVDEERLSDDQKVLYKSGDTTIGTSGLPKKFPYGAPGTRVAGLLSSFYLDERWPIYECNEMCSCGPGCKTRNVQHGRTIGLEIFKTENRGWGKWADICGNFGTDGLNNTVGLRCLEDLKRGQFVDTYRGEIITSEEADEREKSVAYEKASYLFSLDKFPESKAGYVVDGQNFGGPTRFMNHSCEPNCRQYTVSYNKYDEDKYEIAIFAFRNIPKGEELTFDYLDKDDGESDDDENETQPHTEGQTKIECKCGSTKCRKTLWI